MDIATVVGIVSAFALVIISIMMGGGLGLFINIPSLLIVVGGTMGATLVNYPLADVLGVFKVVKNVFFTKVWSTQEVVDRFVDFANKSRREGILALEAEVPTLDDEFMVKGLQLTIDGMEPDSIREILETEIEYLEERHKLGAEILTTMATFFPALGMIGTLIGLVQMLATMDDPSTIGPSMAVALLTTFYGAVAANLVCLPMAGKLKKRSQEETLVKEMVISGIVSVANGENPRVIEQKLHSFVPPSQRESKFD
ncbi:chemotaxis protein MotA [Desulfacinum hydrothermale DSM 13146]|uniref:Chemotaxis protein MotA n=1 Tax=Desulfacinum hydrothermale DSM 13146 TaxID=1121390 RepID=A0A1W1X679_9BACT|nr:motility protein A [Desulfacinum hydrothermale]SMC19327.1 chemotaxis protein MotA [Desulfacinum hydrothermale DSM 13146]